jgi:hypothetical protein
VVCPATDRESGPAPNRSLQFWIDQRMLSSAKGAVSCLGESAHISVPVILRGIVRASQSYAARGSSSCRVVVSTRLCWKRSYLPVGLSQIHRHDGVDALRPNRGHNRVCRRQSAHSRPLERRVLGLTRRGRIRRRESFWSDRPSIAGVSSREIRRPRRPPLGRSFPFLRHA